MVVPRIKEFQIPEQTHDSWYPEFTRREVEEARTRHYKGWWAIGPLENLRPHLRPLFIVRPRSERDRALAIAAKPPLVRAVILGK